MIEAKDLLAIDVFGLVLFSVYTILFFLIYFFLLQKEKLNSLFNISLVITSFLLPIIFFLLNEVFKIKSNPPDTVVYASLINDFSSYFNLYSFGVKSFSILNFIQYKLCFERPFVFIVFNVFYYQLAIFFFFKAFKLYINHQRRLVYNPKGLFSVMVIFSEIYPLALILNASILRESMALMFLAMFSYFMIKYIVTTKNTMAMTLFVLTPIFIIRPLTGVCATLALFMGYCYKNKLYTLRNFVWLIVIILIADFGLKMIVSSLYQIDFNLSWLISYRDASNTKFGDEGYSTMNWTGPFAYIKNIFLLILQYLFSPLPILVSPAVTMNKVIPLIDSFYIIIVLIAPICLFYKKYMNGWLGLFLIFLIIPALFETNISGAYRHRMSAVFFLIPLVSHIVLTFKLPSDYGRG
ncbi:hypothetical protein [Muricauda brasiliensis]|uniref:hypothetical protein n=1 Tax=Muricauda brasiliensis TaxID=2162892 RepID=UPI000D378F0B|nr:hypothetical protein [Muricauda brasiliensis]